MSALPPPIFRQLMRDAQQVIDGNIDYNERVGNIDPQEWRTVFRMLDHVRKQDDGRSERLDKACYALSHTAKTSFDPDKGLSFDRTGVEAVDYDRKSNVPVYDQRDIFDKDAYYAFKTQVRSILAGEQLTPKQAALATAMLAAACRESGAVSDYFQKVEEAMEERAAAAEYAGRSAAVN